MAPWSRFFWPLGAGANLKKYQEPETEPLEKKSGAGAANKLAGSPALFDMVVFLLLVYKINTRRMVLQTTPPPPLHASKSLFASEKKNLFLSAHTCTLISPLYIYSKSSSRWTGSTSLRNITVLLFGPNRLKSARKNGEHMLSTSLWAEKNFCPAARVQSVYSSLWQSSSAPAKKSEWWSFHFNKKSSPLDPILAGFLVIWVLGSITRNEFQTTLMLVLYWQNESLNFESEITFSLWWRPVLTPFWIKLNSRPAPNLAAKPNQTGVYHIFSGGGGKYYLIILFCRFFYFHLFSLI